MDRTIRLTVAGLMIVFIISATFVAQERAWATDVAVSGAVSATLGDDSSAAAGLTTATPIKHLVVIFQENVSFDHYFGTYPHAANPPGEPRFVAAANTPSVNGLSADLLTHNPNLVQPFRLDRSQALTCDMDHDYTPEQQAVDGGKMDKFVQYTDANGSSSNSLQYCPTGVVMGYYDGNTVTALWNYAQHFAMDDNSFGTVFGPSTPGALNLISGETGGVLCGNSAVYNPPATCSATTPPAQLNGAQGGTVTGDPDQYYDDCSKGGTSSKTATAALAGRNVGDLLNAAGATWGWFNGGFDNCKATHVDIALDLARGVDPSADTITSTSDYSAHHEAFQYYASTSNPHHLPPSSVALIGQTDQANHQYDLTRFWQAADTGNLPAVSFLKAPKYQDGHAGYSDPLDEQQFLVDTINHLQSLPSWKSTAVIISYDDSDGWYDHAVPPQVNHSHTTLDVNCGATNDGSPARCGYGPRLPYLVISPWARANFVDHTLTDQSSTLRFIEDNWLNGQRIDGQSFDNKAGSILGMFDFTHPPAYGARRLILSPTTGEAVRGGSGFVVSFTSSQPGRGLVLFGSGPGCGGLVETATVDEGSGTTHHSVQVTGNDLAGTAGDIGITPGATYWYETETVTASGMEIDNNGGQCFTATTPRL